MRKAFMYLVATMTILQVIVFVAVVLGLLAVGALCAGIYVFTGDTSFPNSSVFELMNRAATAGVLCAGLSLFTGIAWAALADGPDA